MSSLAELSLDRLSPARIWAALDRETRTLAASAVYEPDYAEGMPRREADQAIAQALRFREARVKQLPVRQRIDYLVKAVRPDDGQAHSWLLALHLVHRRSLLERFLDELGVPQEDGLIEADHELTAPEPQKLTAAVETLRGEFPDDQVDLYLLSLLAMDPDIWAGLKELVGPRAGAG